MGTDSEDFPPFSRNEPLRLLLDAFVVNDEEEELLSSILHPRRKTFPWFNINPIPSFNGTILGEEPANSLLYGFALAFDRHAESFASSFNAYSSS